MLGTDLSPFFQADHFAQTYVCNGVTGLGILDEPGEMLQGDQIVSTDYRLMVKTAELRTPNYGDAITVGGTAYTVRYARAIDDGAITEIILTKV